MFIQKKPSVRVLSLFSLVSLVLLLGIVSCSSFQLRIPPEIRNNPTALKSYMTRYRTGSMHKAFVVAENGYWSWTYGYATRELARLRALNRCQEATKSKCRIVNLDNNFIKRDFLSSSSMGGNAIWTDGTEVKIIGDYDGELYLYRYHLVSKEKQFIERQINYNYNITLSHNYHFDSDGNFYLSGNFQPDQSKISYDKQEVFYLKMDQDFKIVFEKVVGSKNYDRVADSLVVGSNQVIYGELQEKGEDGYSYNNFILLPKNQEEYVFEKLPLEKNFEAKGIAKSQQKDQDYFITSYNEFEQQPMLARINHQGKVVASKKLTLNEKNKNNDIEEMYFSLVDDKLILLIHASSSLENNQETYHLYHYDFDLNLLESHPINWERDIRLKGIQFHNGYGYLYGKEYIPQNQERQPKYRQEIFLKKINLEAKEEWSINICGDDIHAITFSPQANSNGKEHIFLTGFFDCDKEAEAIDKLLRIYDEDGNPIPH